jgi:hypothetical protein
VGRRAAHLCSEAGRARRRRDDPTQRNDRLVPPRSRQRQRCPLTCGFGARGGIRTLDLPITSRFPTVHDLASSAVLAGQVRCVVRLIRVVSYGVGRGGMTGRMTAALPNHQIGSLSVAIRLEGGQPPRPAPDATNRLRRRVQRVGPAGDHPSPGGWWLRWTMTEPGRSASPATRKPGCRSSSSTGDARSPATVKTCKQRTLRLAMGRRRREEATRWRRRRRRPGRPRRWPRTAPVLGHRLSGDHPWDVVRR